MVVKLMVFIQNYICIIDTICCYYGRRGDENGVRRTMIIAIYGSQVNGVYSELYLHNRYNMLLLWPPR